MNQKFLTITLIILIIILVSILVYVIIDKKSDGMIDHIPVVNQTDSTQTSPFFQDYTRPYSADMFCLSHLISKDKYIKYFNELNRDQNVGDNVETLFNLTNFKKLITENKKDASGGIQQLCYFGNFIGFELYDLNKHKSIVGIYNPASYGYSKQELVFDQMADNTTCEITGAVAEGLIHRCVNENSINVYLLNRFTGKSKILQDCLVSKGELECKIDLLKI